MEARRSHSDVIEAVLAPVAPVAAVEAFRQLCRSLYETEAKTRKAGQPTFFRRKPPPGGGEVVSGQFEVWDCLKVSSAAVFRFVPRAGFSADLEADGARFKPIAPPKSRRLVTVSLPVGEDGRVAPSVMSCGARGLICSLQAALDLSWDRPPKSRWFLDVSPRDFVWALSDAAGLNAADPARRSKRGVECAVEGRFCGRGYPVRWPKGKARV